MPARVRYLLLQVRNSHDPMREHEVGCFARALGCERERIRVFDLISGVPGRAVVDSADVVLLGGSGDYSVAEGGPWLPAALDGMRELVEWSKPTFASCWGFQAMARALGGEVVTDLTRAELGTHAIHLTEAGQRDPIFGELNPAFEGQMGHQDIVIELPVDAVLLASSDLVENQAFCLPGKPIYCTQFHPELNRDDLHRRVRAYPRYVEAIAGMTVEQLARHCRDTPQAEGLLRRFVQHVLK
ncbi:MAG: type 1 glutamine amidotransferase [Planctomycetes bacterium]|nr:type 1 glutamine amidotransferase [Planctomycetota bacterium]